MFRKRNGLPYMTGGHVYHGSPNSLDPTLIFARPGGFLLLLGGWGRGGGIGEGGRGVVNSIQIPTICHKFHVICLYESPNRKN
jgi:hypothetical protein